MSEIPFPGFERIFAIKDPLANPPFRGMSAISHVDHVQLLRGDSRRIQPVRIDHAMGGRTFDTIWLTSATVPIVSERAIEVLQTNRFTGWETYPVEVYGEDGSLIPGYYGLTVTGRCGTRDLGRSREEMRQMPGGMFPFYIGLYFDQASWDGSDLFMLSDGSAVVFAVERVRTALVRAMVRNIRWVRLTEYEMDRWVYNDLKRHIRSDMG